MNHKAIYIRLSLLIFSLGLSIIFAFFCIKTLPIQITLFVGALFLLLNLVVIPGFNSIKTSINTIDKSQKHKLQLIGYPISNSKITYAEAFSWLRDNKDIYVYPQRYTDNGFGFAYEVIEEKEPHYRIVYSDGYCENYDDMEFEALESVFKLVNNPSKYE